MNNAQIPPLPNAYLNDAQFRNLQIDNDVTYVESRYNFLKGHAGLRPGCMHVLIGTKGSGKSTIVRSILQDCSKYRCLVWLSEESMSDFQLGIGRLKLPEKQLKNLRVLSEKELDAKYKRDLGTYLNYIEERIKELTPHVVIFDNITTSRVYNSLRPGDQAHFIDSLSALADKYTFPLLVVAHTKKGVRDNAQLIDSDDVRGNSTLVNIAPYVYIYQRIELFTEFFPFIHIAKARNHLHQGKFQLTFCPETRSIIRDAKLTKEEFNNYFVEREK